MNKAEQAIAYYNYVVSKEHWKCPKCKERYCGDEWDIDDEATALHGTQLVLRFEPACDLCGYVIRFIFYFDKAGACEVRMVELKVQMVEKDLDEEGDD